MIYYVEDDANIRNLAIYALEQNGFCVRGFSCAEDFFDGMEQNQPDLILLDIMLPGKDGLEVLRELRSDSETSDIPVMMLTAKGTEYDKVIGLNSGADDYLAKPFSMLELASRCNALLRRSTRSAAKQKNFLSCGAISIDTDAYEACVNGVPLDLTLKEFSLLQKLIVEKGRVLSRAQLLESVWGISFVGESRTVDTHIQTLRRKLNEASFGLGDMVQTVRGVGYRIKES